MYIDSNGDAEANYTVVALKPDLYFFPMQQSMSQVGYFQPSEDGTGIPVSPQILYRLAVFNPLPISTLLDDFHFFF